MDIEVKNLSKSYGELNVFSNLNCRFNEGAVSCVMGKSGSGKTTLLRILLGLTDCDSGVINGLEGRRFSAVFQEDRLCENITALLNVKMVSDISGKYSDEDICKFFRQIGIDAAEKKPVSEFSGGMKRRVAILRALLADYDTLVMDEPLKGLDEETKNQTIELIKILTVGKNVIMTTHDQREAGALDANLINIEVSPLI